MPTELSRRLRSSSFLETGILELNKVALAPQDIDELKRRFQDHQGYLNYREALQCVNIDKNQEDPLLSQWILSTASHQRAKSTQGFQTYDDTRSNYSLSSSKLSQISMDPQLRMKADRVMRDMFLKKEAHTIQENEHENESLVVGDDYNTFSTRQVPMQKSSTQLLDNSRRQFNHHRKKKTISLGKDPRIYELQKRLADDEANGIIAPLLPEQSPKKDGKKIDASKFYTQDLITHGHFKHDKERFDRDMLERDYQLSFVQKRPADSDMVIVENLYKQKVSPEFLKNVLNTAAIGEDKKQLMRTLSHNNFDFRILNNLKIKLFEYNTSANDEMKMEEYQYIVNTYFKDKVRDFEDLLLSEIKVNICLTLQINDNFVSLSKLSELMDFYNYYPVKINKHKNQSDQLYYIMTSNLRGESSLTSNHQFKPDHVQDKQLQACLDILGTKISEKFATVAQAFRFFDQNCNQRISFTEFCSTLEHLRVKLQTEDLKKIFAYLDSDNDGHIGYIEFCSLTEEKRKGIDPFMLKSQKALAKMIDQSNTLESNDVSTTNRQSTLNRNQSPMQIKDAYVTHLKVEDLEDMSKIQALSGAKKRAFKLVKNQSSRGNDSDQNSKTTRNIEAAVAYGKSSLTFHGPKDDISQLINQSYLKDYLEDKVTKTALQQVLIKNQKDRSSETRANELRSKSLAKVRQIQDGRSQLELLKQTKSNRNNISFTDIQRNEFKINKGVQLPPIQALMERSFSVTKSNNNHGLIDVLQTNNGIQRSESKPNNYSSLKTWNIKNNTTQIDESTNTILNPEVSQQAVLDEIHQLRLKVNERKEMERESKPVNSKMTKKERQEMMNNYFNAKKKLANLQQ